MRGVGSAPKSMVFFSNSTVRDSSTSLGMTNGRGRRALPSGLRSAASLPTRALPPSVCYKCRMKISLLSILSLSILSAGPALAQQTPQSLAEAELPSLLTIYKDLHTHPELSTHEERSSAIVAKELKLAGCEVTEHVGKYEKPGATCFGVIGVMKNGAGPTVLVRTDLDALPVHEETGVPYASTFTTKNDEGKEVPVMHACGHDAHISMFIGVARVLAKLKDQWHGAIVFVAQPAEETGNGARALLQAGLYEKFGKPDFALGFHDKADMQTGHI